MKMLLDGRWVDRDKTIDVNDPYDNSLVDTIPAGSKQDVEVALSAAVKGFEITKRMTVMTEPRCCTRRPVLYPGAWTNLPPSLPVKHQRQSTKPARKHRGVSTP